MARHGHRPGRAVVTAALASILAFWAGAGLVPRTAQAQRIDAAPTVSHSRLGAGVPSLLSWYGETLRLTDTHSFQRLYFDGASVGIEMTASCPVDGSFTVSLYRHVSGTAQLVGSASFKRNGFTKATWEGVGPGFYQFVCQKPADRQVVTSSDVAMYSW